MTRAAAILPVPVLALVLLFSAQDSSSDDRLARHRNLGKAFYENPTTQAEAVEQLALALKLAPNSARERLNYGLALLRAGKTEQGVAELQKVQQQDPSLPHTWFNLGIAWKKAGEHERAAAQFERMIQLVPDEPIAHYNLGALYRILGRQEEAVRHFERAAQLDATLAAPHFQLFNAYRTANRMEDAKRELAIFQQLKKSQEGAAIPEDVEWCAWAELYDMAPERAMEPPADLRFTSRTLPQPAKGVLPVDIRNAGRAQLLLWSEEGVRLEPGGNVSDLKDVTSAQAADFNNDGWQDVLLLTSKGPVLLANQKGKLLRHDASLPSGSWNSALWVDYDHDYDLDLILGGEKPVLLRNAGAAGFEDRTADFPFVSGKALSLTSFRVVADTKGFDIVMSYADRAAVLYRDQLQGRYKPEDLKVPAGALHLTAADADNDGYFDLLFTTPEGLHLARNDHKTLAAPARIGDGSGPFAPGDFAHRAAVDLAFSGAVLRATGKGSFSRGTEIPACSAVAVADTNGDALPDVICVENGAVKVLTNATPLPDRHWIGVQLTGVRNLKLARGSEVEIKAGAIYQKKEYDGLPLVFGIGREKAVETVRITWPNGLIQNEIRQPADKVHTWKEAQRLSGSCPMIWTWNGSGFQYITDVLGVAPLGAASGDGDYFPVDHDEYIQIPGSALRPRDGALEVRITEELSEVAYLDLIQLQAVDRPAGLRVYTNDKFKAPPFPEFRLFGVRSPVRPIRAAEDTGRDVLARVLRQDRTYPTGFPRDLSGTAKPHYLELDFGPDAARDNKAVLILHGWVDWADGSTFLGASQQKQGGLMPPSLQVRDSAGRWVTVIEDMGMPAGKPKTIAVDLTGKFLSASREIRIVTNLCVYWDEIFLSEDIDAPPVTLRPAGLLTAELRFRGFSPNQVHPQRLQPEQFRYEGPSPVSMWNPTPGLYTRYGDVRELAAEIDDRLILMGSGDELVLRFDAASLPPVPPGFERDYLLLVDGWAKDRDANTGYGQSTEPLPFHSMSRYPYGAEEHFPDTPAHRAWREKYLTRPALRMLQPLRPVSRAALR